MQRARARQNQQQAEGPGDPWPAICWAPPRSRPGRLYLAGSGGEGRDMVRVKFVSRGRLLGGAGLQRHAQTGTGPGAGKGAGPGDVGGRAGRDQT